MLIAFVVLIGLLAILGPIAIGTIVSQYRHAHHRRRIRKGIKKYVVAKFGKAYWKQPPGRHRIERRPRAHRVCDKEDPCAYRHKDIRRTKATYYIDRARREAIYRSGVIAGLHCGDYSGDSSTTISFAGLSTPAGSRERFTARRTSMPMSPIST